MGLYLCVFDEDEEVEGVEVGAYGDFGRFRDAVQAQLEGGVRGSRFPTLMLHSDCDGSWSSSDAAVLEQELRDISEEFQRLPAISIPDGWQVSVARMIRLVPATLYDCFFDVDGEPLLGRLRELGRVAAERGLPILFQ